MQKKGEYNEVNNAKIRCKLRNKSKQRNKIKKIGGHY